MVAVQGDVRAPVGEKRVLGLGRQSLQQLRGALQPSARLGRSAKLCAVERQLDCQARRGAGVSALPGEPIRPLVGGKGCRAIHLPAGGRAKPLERSNRLAGHERSLELCLGLCPRRADKGSPSGGEPILY
jgi:hypothetical protein